MEGAAPPPGVEMETDDVGATLPGVEFAMLTALLVTSIVCIDVEVGIGKKEEGPRRQNRGVVLGHVATCCVEN